MRVKRPSANGVVKSGSSRPEPYATVANISDALPSEKYNAIRRSHVFDLISKLDVPFPAELPEISSSDTFPIRISTVEDRELSNLASFWGAQYTHIVGLLSLARAERKRLEAVKGIAEKKIFDTIRRIRDEFGTAVLIVEQQAQQILRIADQVFVIRAGRLISQGPVENYRGEDALRQVYLSDHKPDQREGDRP